MRVRVREREREVVYYALRLSPSSHDALTADEREIERHATVARTRSETKRSRHDTATARPIVVMRFSSFAFIILVLSLGRSGRASRQTTSWRKTDTRGARARKRDTPVVTTYGASDTN